MRAIKLLGDQFAVPAEDGVRFDDRGDVCQGFLAQLVADLRQGLALAITQPYTALELIAEQAIFGHQILMTQEELLVH